MSCPVHIVAATARTPLGLTLEASAAAYRAGINRFVEHPFMVNCLGDRLVSAMDARLDPRILGTDRLAALAELPLRQLAAQLMAQAPWPDPIRLHLALPELRPGFSAMDAERIKRHLTELRPGGLSLDIELHCLGHAAGLYALHLAKKEIEEQGAQLILIGGTESYLQADTLDWLESHRRVNNDETRSAFIPGEGAGFVAVASEAGRHSLGLPSLATVRSTGLGKEEILWDSDEESFGAGLIQAIQAATVGLKLPEEKIQSVYCDINGERYRGQEWGFAILRTQEASIDPSHYEAPAIEWGDMGAATGPLSIGLPLDAWSKQIGASTRAMHWTSSDRGMRVASILQRPA